jgi:hypothetical protein
MWSVWAEHRHPLLSLGAQRHPDLRSAYFPVAFSSYSPFVSSTTILGLPCLFFVSEAHRPRLGKGYKRGFSLRAPPLPSQTLCPSYRIMLRATSFAARPTALFSRTGGTQNALVPLAQSRRASLAGPVSALRSVLCGKPRSVLMALAGSVAALSASDGPLVPAFPASCLDEPAERPHGARPCESSLFDRSLAADRMLSLSKPNYSSSVSPSSAWTCGRTLPRGSKRLRRSTLRK